MSVIPLRLGPLGGKGFAVHRSGFRWLCADGHLCRSREVIAYCKAGLALKGGLWAGAEPFAEEERDFYIAVAPSVGGRLRIAADSSHGGWSDLLTNQVWSPDFVVAELECEAGADDGDGAPPSQLELLLLAGRKLLHLAEDGSGLMAEWYERSRAWWGGGGTFGTLVSIGVVCEVSRVIRGDRLAFLEMFAAVPGPAHIVFTSEGTLVPCAAVAAEQLRRTPAQTQAIAADLIQSLATGPAVPNAADWMFAGSLLSDLQRSPLSESYDLLTREGLARSGPADAVLMSLSAESASILRHKRLGYAINCHAFRVNDAGPAIRAWLKRDFEPVRRTPDDIRRDYVELIDAVRARSNMRFLVVNSLATSSHEDVYSYSAFDEPMRDTLSSIRTGEMNLMLHDCARERDMDIVDLDAMAADIGATMHLPDGIHPSGLLQAELRGEILRILKARAVPGFGAR